MLATRVVATNLEYTRRILIPMVPRSLRGRGGLPRCPVQNAVPGAGLGGCIQKCHKVRLS